MAKMPDPVKKKTVKSAVSRSKAIEKASAAEAKASRGQVMQKVRYPKMSTASGAAEAAKRGAGVARNAMGGFGKTNARPMISNEGKVANQASRRKAIAGRKAANAKIAKKQRTQVTSPTGSKSPFGYYKVYEKPAMTSADKAGSQRNRQRAIAKTQASTRAKASAAAKKQKSLAVGRAKSKANRMK